MSRSSNNHSYFPAYMRLFQTADNVFLSEDRVYQAKDANFPFVLKRSSRRRTLSILISEQGDIKVSVPLRTPDERIRRFLEEKESWILKGLSWARRNKEAFKKKGYSQGNEFLFLGAKHPLEFKEYDINRSCIVFDGDKWVVCISSADKLKSRDVLAKKLLSDWYRKEAEVILKERTADYAKLMEVSFRQMKVRSLKRIWGNCDFRTQVITFNWQVIQCPIEVIDYVVVHELCHLTVPDHSKRFWKKVGEVMPAYKKHVKWLKDNHLETVLP